MLCTECETLENELIRVRTARNSRRMRRELTPEAEARLESEELSLLFAIQGHKASHHE